MSRYLNGVAAALVLLAACNDKAPVRTRDDIAADSALAADLALANRDTLVIDSISRPVGVIPADTDLAGSLEGKARTTPAPPPSVAVAVPPAAPPTAAPPPAAPAAVTSTPRPTKAAAPRAVTRRA